MADIRSYQGPYEARQEYIALPVSQHPLTTQLDSVGFSSFAAQHLACWLPVLCLILWNRDGMAASKNNIIRLGGFLLNALPILRI